mmetsp:Transcript_1802/g.3482  ORF Transcript_1802/g.3482 Transcript_1802/m.3482 type:complete len:669 (-) Transcript_1802:1325-3331(-)
METATPCKHYRVVREICDTESKYVRNLNTLNEVYYRPLQVQKSKMLDDGLIAVFFSNVSQILALNTKFATDLSRRLSAWHMPNQPASVEPLGDIFIKYAPLFELYCEYAGSFDDVAARIRNHENTNPSLCKFLNTCAADARCEGRTLQAFLIMPIQRVPRYPLLLRELLRTLPADHKSRDSVAAALARAERAARRIEREMRERTEVDKLLALQQKFDSALVLARPGRRLLASSALRRRGHRSEKAAIFFLFTDLLVYAEEAGGRFIPRGEFALHRCRADAPPAERDPTAPRTIQFRSPEYSFEMVFPDSAERSEWLSMLQSAVQSSRLYLQYTEITPRNSLVSNKSSTTSSKSETQGQTLPSSADGCTSITVTAAKPSKERKKSSGLKPTQINPSLLSSAQNPRRESKKGSGAKRKKRTKDAKRGSKSLDGRRGHRIELPPFEAFAPVWSPNTEQCERCSTYFGILGSRHHCRRCGRCVCGKCSTHRVDLTCSRFPGRDPSPAPDGLRAAVSETGGASRPAPSGPDEEGVRVCDTCFKEHKIAGRLPASPKFGAPDAPDLHTPSIARRRSLRKVRMGKRAFLTREKCRTKMEHWEELMTASLFYFLFHYLSPCQVGCSPPWMQEKAYRHGTKGGNQTSKQLLTGLQKAIGDSSLPWRSKKRRERTCYF